MLENEELKPFFLPKDLTLENACGRPRMPKLLGIICSYSCREASCLGSQCDNLLIVEANKTWSVQKVIHEAQQEYLAHHPNSHHVFKSAYFRTSTNDVMHLPSSLLLPAAFRMRCVDLDEGLQVTFGKFITYWRLSFEHSVAEVA